MSTENNHTSIQNSSIFVPIAIQKIFADISKIANHYPAIEKIILFGSRARGDHSERSDIDIAIIAPEIDPAEWLNLCEQIDEIETLLEFDIVNFGETDNKLKAKINQEGKIIYERC